MSKRNEKYKMSTAARKENRYGLAFVTPPFIGFCLFMAFPIVFAFIATTIQLAAVFSAVIFQYPMYVDLLEMFLKKETAMICAIVGMIFPSALSIMIFIAGMKDVRRPDEIIGEYVEVE